MISGGEVKSEAERLRDTVGRERSPSHHCLSVSRFFELQKKKHEKKLT